MPALVQPCTFIRELNTQIQFNEKLGCMLKKSANNNALIQLMKNVAACVVMLFLINNAIAQPADDLKAKLADRSKKIVNTLAITDSGVYSDVVESLVAQYYNLNLIHDKYKAAVTDIKAKNLAKEEADKLVAEEAAKKAAALQELHKTFLSSLATKVSAEKIDKIKDGMTYNVFPITYAAYQKMILSLTDLQKQKIYDWLKEARELAMDEGSSDDKHKMFGKYKGKINNYLSAQGYDVKKEGEEWAKREEAAKKAQQPQN